MKRKIFILVLSLILSLAVLFSLSFCSESYPSRPISIIVPYGAGGTADIAARSFAFLLSEQLSKPVVILNQPGASGAMGTKRAANSPNDGYTLLLCADSLGTQRLMGLSELSYDDFDVVSALVDDPKIVVVSKASPYKTIEDLLKAIKENPNKIRMSYTGPGGSGHVQQLILKKLGYEASATAYSSGAECLLALQSGQVDFTNANFSSLKAYIEESEVRLLASCSVNRLSGHEELQAMGEIFSENKELFDIEYTPLSLLAPKGISTERLERLRAASKNVFQSEKWQKYCDENSFNRLFEKYPDEGSAREFYKRWQKIVCWLLYDAGAAKIIPSDIGIEK